MTVIGIVSPGAMGSGLARAWRAGGARTVATVIGRSVRTQGLAAGLELVPTLADVVAASDLVVSICPPGAAESCYTDIVDAAEATGTHPLIADLNAIAPALVEGLAARAEAAGLAFVDGSISGGPPGPGSATMLFLSGARAEEVAHLETDGLRRRVVGPAPGTASAVKMCTASVYKGTAALWSQALQTADRLGVLDVVLDDLRESDPGGVEDAAGRLAMAGSKSGRYVAEMEQIAATQGTAGTSWELFDGMAAVYRRLATTPLAQLSPEAAQDLDDLVEVLRRMR